MSTAGVKRVVGSRAPSPKLLLEFQDATLYAIGNRIKIIRINGTFAADHGNSFIKAKPRGKKLTRTVAMIFIDRARVSARHPATEKENG
jgi:hypothetical protein